MDLMLNQMLLTNNRATLQPLLKKELMAGFVRLNMKDDMFKRNEFSEAQLSFHKWASKLVEQLYRTSARKYNMDVPISALAIFNHVFNQGNFVNQLQKDLTPFVVASLVITFKTRMESKDLKYEDYEAFLMGVKECKIPSFQEEVEAHLEAAYEKLGSELCFVPSAFDYLKLFTPLLPRGLEYVTLTEDLISSYYSISTFKTLVHPFLLAHSALMVVLWHNFDNVAIVFKMFFTNLMRECGYAMQSEGSEELEKALNCLILKSTKSAPTMSSTSEAEEVEKALNCLILKLTKSAPTTSSTPEGSVLSQTETGVLSKVDNAALKSAPTTSSTPTEGSVLSPDSQVQLPASDEAFDQSQTETGVLSKVDNAALK